MSRLVDATIELQPDCFVISIPREAAEDDKDIAEALAKSSLRALMASKEYDIFLLLEKLSGLKSKMFSSASFLYEVNIIIDEFEALKKSNSGDLSFLAAVGLALNFKALEEDPQNETLTNLLYETVDKIIESFEGVTYE